MKNIDRKAGEGSSSSSNKSVWNTGSPDDTLDMSVEEITDAKDPHAADGYIKAANANPETPSFGDAAHNKQDKHGLHRKVIAGMLVAALASGVGVATKGIAQKNTSNTSNQPSVTWIPEDKATMSMDKQPSFADVLTGMPEEVKEKLQGLQPARPEQTGDMDYVEAANANSETPSFNNGSEVSLLSGRDERPVEVNQVNEDDERVVEYTTYGRNGNGTTTTHWEVGPDGKEVEIGRASCRERV